MKGDYFVLYNGQRSRELSFYGCKYFTEAENARKYALGHLPAAIGKIAPLTAEDEKLVRDKEHPYLVVGERAHALYCMGEYDGISHSYVATRSGADSLEAAIREISEAKDVEKTFAGIELKMG